MMGGMSNLQEAFFKTDKLDSQHAAANESIGDVSPDSVCGANFSILQSDNLISSFSQISSQEPGWKVQDMATVQ